MKTAIRFSRRCRYCVARDRRGVERVGVQSRADRAGMRVPPLIVVVVVVVVSSLLVRVVVDRPNAIVDAARVAGGAEASDRSMCCVGMRPVSKNKRVHHVSVSVISAVAEGISSAAGNAATGFAL